MKLDNQLVEIIVKVNSILNDYNKTRAWLTTKNLNFGDISPMRLIERGRGHKVLEFIDDALFENKPEGEKCYSQK